MSEHPLASRGSPMGRPSDAAATAQAVRRMFDQVAPRYDFLNHFLSLGLDIFWRRIAARALRDVLSRSGSVAADVCCGTGDLALAFARHSAGIVVGTDFSKPMLLRAQSKSRSRKLRPIFLESDTLRLPFRDNSLDAIGAAFGFRNLANYADGLSEMRRVLKPGGMIAILEFSRVRWPLFGPLFDLYFQHVLPRIGSWVSGTEGPYQYLPASVKRFPDQEELASAFRAAGFAKVRYRNFTGGVAALHVGEKGAAGGLQESK
jgi:demethylmenaquinone methyltransferase / 2-methoxy-6-polyprenyl-1,4-benzoquinol methylase